MEMEQQEVRQDLPEALVEKIIAMMPFPSIFKARALSKLWREKFAPISSSSSRTEKSLVAAAAFQRQVRQWSTNWKTSPVVLDYDLVTYDRAAQDWVRLPSMLSFLHNYSRNYCPIPITYPPAIEGALLYGFSSGSPRVRCGSSHVLVANLLTGSWRLLPPHAGDLYEDPYSFLFLKLVVYPSLNIYKVIIFCKKEEPDYSSDDYPDYSPDAFPDYSPDEYCVQIYDSKSGAWRSKNFKISSGFTTDGPHVGEYLNGVLYMVGQLTPQNLLAFNVEEETLEELRLSLDDDETLKGFPFNLVICNVNCLMLVTSGWGWYEDQEGDPVRRFRNEHTSLQVFRIDLRSRQLLRLAVKGHYHLGTVASRGFPPVGVGNCLYFFRAEGYRRRLVSYNVDEDVWTDLVLVPAHRFSWNEYSSFQPGLSPFMPV